MVLAINIRNELEHNNNSIKNGRVNSRVILILAKANTLTEIRKSHKLVSRFWQGYGRSYVSQRLQI